jgi:hypothetical protein
MRGLTSLIDGLPIPSPRLREEGRGEGAFRLADGRLIGRAPHPNPLPAGADVRRSAMDGAAGRGGRERLCNSAAVA